MAGTSWKPDETPLTKKLTRVALERAVPALRMRTVKRTSSRSLGACGDQVMASMVRSTARGWRV
jgi:hypothetical protein